MAPEEEVTETEQQKNDTVGDIESTAVLDQGRFQEMSFYKAGEKGILSLFLDGFGITASLLTCIVILKILKKYNAALNSKMDKMKLSHKH